ncbi:Lipoate-protein ligase A [Mycoplasmopsis californica]|uniref:lipoate--protein ligase n=1 Tax=Mycoplasmopsis equigenitalium TaxID=114883 RepID=A0ABY5J118_9BACT|nr:lipoate--protein ligase [Mycoplasmopsis equigenitalium]UUD36943.1 lipoate--protein ligase [Mycoplasmopsis equigenitalium]VEU69762.1 Lipoate-protein ligase A [Mycoplasmopsis californica]
MIVLKMKSNEPYKTLSLEELILKDEKYIDQDIMLLYQHDNSIIIGRNQNLHEEINLDYTNEHNIKIARRISGGGAVYHDLNNLNFSFITNKTTKGYKQFLQPIIEYLNQIGVPAQFEGRNDIKANGLKISGNAQFIYKNRMFSHGTLLFNVNIEKMVGSLKPNPLKMQSKGIKSVRQRVGNIKDMLKEDISIDDFANNLIKYMQEKYGAVLKTEKDFDYKEHAALAKYKQSDEWLYFKNPEFSIVNTMKFDNGLISFKANLEENKIKSIAFEGDFLSQKEMSDVIHLFDNANYDKKTFATILDKIDLNLYFGWIKKEELITLIFG